MNETIKLLLSHKSDRSYLEKELPEEVLNNVINAAWRAPTSVHTQQVSVIVTRDPVTKARITELSGGQPWIARAPVFLTFVLDLNKTHKGLDAIGEKQLAHTSIEGIVSGTQDVGLHSHLPCWQPGRRAWVWYLLVVSGKTRRRSSNCSDSLK